MSESIQSGLVFVLVGCLSLYWLQRILRPLWAPVMSDWLLRRGKVGLAMRLRFGKRRC